MLKTGIKKELMFFTRSFRLWGVIIAAAAFMILDPALIKLSGVLLESIGTDTNNIQQADVMDIEDYGGDMDMTEIITPQLGVVGASGDISGTMILIFMLVTMYTAGGELKKRSMIIPQNAGLTPRLYITPKFIVYPILAGVIAFAAMIGSYLFSFCLYDKVEMTFGSVAMGSLAVAVFCMFMITLYFTIGLCTKKAGIAVVIMYGGNILFTALFQAFRADKFHPFVLTTQAQNIFMGEEADLLNFWGSIGVTVLLMILCYFVTLFVISAGKVDNIGEEEAML